MKKYYESDYDLEEKRFRCKRGKRGYPGFQGPPGPTGQIGPTGPVAEVYYGEVISTTTQPNRVGSLNPITFDEATYLNGIDLETIPQGSAIIIENPGLYFLEYNLTFINESLDDALVSLGIFDFRTLTFFDLKIGVINGAGTFPGFLTISSSRYLNIEESDFIIVAWMSNNPDVALFSQDGLNSGQLSLTQISGPEFSPVLRSVKPDLSTINLDLVKEKLSQHIQNFTQR